MLNLIKEQEVLGKTLKVYGDWNNPLFLAKDVAEWIEHSNPRMMLQKIDEDEKVKAMHPVNNPYGGYQEEEQWFLTEHGLYEVLMQSRKPIAKEFRKAVKILLATLRKEWRNQSETYSPLLQELMYLESEQKRLGESLDETKRLVTNLKDVVSMDSQSWREDTRKHIVKIAEARGGHGFIQEVRSEIYGKLEARAKVKLGTRKKNKQKRMAECGTSKSKCDKVTKLDVIEEDKVLIEVYVAIVKEMAAALCVNGTDEEPVVLNADEIPDTGELTEITQTLEEAKPLRVYEFKMSITPLEDLSGGKFLSTVMAENLETAAMMALEQWGGKYPYLTYIQERVKPKNLFGLNDKL